jgi:ribose-phosphate pyrophosphokinase
MQEIVIKSHDVIGHKVTKYPDGQRCVTLNLENLNVKEPINIKVSIKNFSDLELLCCVVQALKKNDFHLSLINFVYLFGMRADRSFEKGDCNYFRDVVAPIINSFNCSRIEILNGHSHLSWSAIKNSYFSMLDFFGIKLDDHKEFFLLGADESSRSPKHHGPNIINTGIKFEKKREGSNIIMGLDNNDQRKFLHDLNQDQIILIYDDLCDAGGTFIQAAKYLREKLGLKNRLELLVTHGLFTKGVDNVAPYFDRIITTNSYQEIVHPKVLQIEVI